MRLEGKVALITGGAAGIGKATAERFAEEGAEAVICDVSKELGQSVIQALGQGTDPSVGSRHGFYGVDVTDRDAVQVWVDDVAERHGRIDVLVNNAGIIRDALLVKVRDGELVKQMPEVDFDLVVAINLKGVFN